MDTPIQSLIVESKPYGLTKFSSFYWYLNVTSHHSGPISVPPTRSFGSKLRTLPLATISVEFIML
ncbi:hypothetical protein HanRHA438_Chr10g0433521 [Helianthus annuus]|nr:hypothetical protein HanRHA438_Chr10g0433521 [Helianthus annuus]